MAINEISCSFRLVLEKFETRKKRNWWGSITICTFPCKPFHRAYAMHYSNRKKLCYLVMGRPRVVPGRTPAIPCCVIGRSKTFMFIWAVDGKPVLTRANPPTELIVFSRVLPVITRCEYAEAEGGLVNAFLAGVIALSAAFWADASRAALCNPLRDTGLSILVCGLPALVVGLSTKFDTDLLISSCCSSFRQWDIGLSPDLPVAGLSIFNGKVQFYVKLPAHLRCEIITLNILLLRCRNFPFVVHNASPWQPFVAHVWYSITIIIMFLSRSQHPIIVTYHTIIIFLICIFIVIVIIVYLYNKHRVWCLQKI